MSRQSKEEYLESCRRRYRRRNREGKGAMIEEVSEVFGWGRKHTIKALNGQVSLGGRAGRRGRRATHGEVERAVIVGVWKRSEQPCGTRLKAALPLWVDSYASRDVGLDEETRERILGYSARTLDRITAPHRTGAGGVRQGRRTGRTSNRIKAAVPVRCGPQEFAGPGWMEADTVSHGGGSTRGAFLWTLTLTDSYSGWTELAALWGCGGGEVRVGLERIEGRMPFAMRGFDCDNGSEFLNDILEAYLLGGKRRVDWTRSRAYKKNDQAHVEQKNSTHVRQLLGYGRFGDLALRQMVDELYERAWLPMRNHFTPVMKLVEKRREGGKVRRLYDTAQTPCDRLLGCAKVPRAVKVALRAQRAERAELDPMGLADDVERRLAELFAIVDRIEEDRREQREWAEEGGPAGPAWPDCAAAPVAIAPCACAPSGQAAHPAATGSKRRKTAGRRVS